MKARFFCIYKNITQRNIFNSACATLRFPDIRVTFQEISCLVKHLRADH